MYIRKKLHEKYVTELLTQSTKALNRWQTLYLLNMICKHFQSFETLAKIVSHFPIAASCFS